MSKETDFDDLDYGPELELTDATGALTDRSINWDARRRVEIYLEEKELKRRLVDLDFDYL